MMAEFNVTSIFPLAWQDVGDSEDIIFILHPNEFNEKIYEDDKVNLDILFSKNISFELWTFFIHQYQVSLIH